MAKVDQLPAELHVAIYRGDAWLLQVDFDIDLTGYTIAAEIHPKDGSTSIYMTIDVVDLSLGQFNTVLTSEQSFTLPAAYHSWCLVMTPPVVGLDPELPRTYFAGRFIVRSCS
jgi:hypothetical protein